MSNSLLTISMITREALRLFRNSNAFLQGIDTQLDSEFGKKGAKIGSTLRIRLPNDYTVRTGATANVQNTTENSVALTVANQYGVDMSFSSAELALSLDDFSKRILAPAVNVIAGKLALDVMSSADGGVANFVAKTDGSGNILSPDASTFLQAGATLTSNSAPMNGRRIVLDPYTNARTVSALSGLFNPASAIGEQYKSGAMKSALGFENWMEDQTVLAHTNGAFGTGTTVAGANQTGNTLVVAATSGPLNVGDIITVAGVHAINRVTKQSTGALRQFAVTAFVPTGSTQIPVYPSIVPGNVAYGTVDASPANDAAVTLTSPSGATYRKNLAFVPEAISLVTAELEIPKGVHEAARESYDGCSMRMVSQYAIQSDTFITRLDLLAGWLFTRPEWVCVVADQI